MKDINDITVCMYGAAREDIDPKYIEQVYELGKQIAARGWKLIYGGGASGLMGAIARGVKDNGGYVIGVVPTWMDQREPVFEADTVIKTDNMADRKKIMEDNADAFIVCPGGVGTLDEFFQILTLKDLSRQPKPIVLFNIDGFYDGLVEFIKEGAEKNFIRENVVDMFCTRDSVDAVLRRIGGEIVEKAVGQAIKDAVG